MLDTGCARLMQCDCYDPPQNAFVCDIGSLSDQFLWNFIKLKPQATNGPLLSCYNKQRSNIMDLGMSLVYYYIT